MKWPPRGRAMKEGRRELPRKINKDGTPSKMINYEHQCKHCEKWFRAKEIELDHTIPIVDVKYDGSLSDEDFIGRFATGLLCYEDNFQKLCIPCHTAKTDQEREIRINTKKSVK